MTERKDKSELPDSTNGMASRARPEIQAMKGYSSARSLTEAGPGTVFLDANECPYEPFIGARNLSRYPMQQPPELVRLACDWLDVSSRNLTVMRGADEAIDSLMRAFCIPAVDNIIICPPTFAMYSQSALLQGVEVREAPLGKGSIWIWMPFPVPLMRIPKLCFCVFTEQSNCQPDGAGCH